MPNEFLLIGKKLVSNNNLLEKVSNVGAATGWGVAAAGIGLCAVNPILGMATWVIGGATMIGHGVRERGNYGRFNAIRNTELENKLRREHGLPEI